MFPCDPGNWWGLLVCTRAAEVTKREYSRTDKVLFRLCLPVFVSKDGGFLSRDPEKHVAVSLACAKVSCNRTRARRVHPYALFSFPVPRYLLYVCFTVRLRTVPRYLREAVHAAQSDEHLVTFSRYPRVRLCGPGSHHGCSTPSEPTPP